MNEPVQVGDGLVPERPLRATVPYKQFGDIGFQVPVDLTPTQQSEAINAAMNCKAIDNMLVGKIGPCPDFPIIDPNSELGKMWAKARAADD